MDKQSTSVPSVRELSLNSRSADQHALLIAQYFYPDVNGSSTRAYNCGQALKKIGYDVTVVTSFPHYPHGDIPLKYKRKIFVREKVNELDVVRTWIPSLAHSPIRNRIVLNLIFIIFSVLAIGRIKKPDVIFAMNPNLFSFYSALIYGLFFRKKIIRNVDDLWPEVFYDLGIVKSQIMKRILNFIAQLSYNYSSSIIPVSSGYVKTLVEKYKIDPKKISVIEHGVDLNKFCKNISINSQKPAKKLIMYSGALAVGYDFESILEAAKILDEEPVQFMIRGSGPMFDNILKMTREHQVSNVDVSNSLLPMDELVSLLNSADIFILPMNATGVIDEGLPTKILEYQALGKPIICISDGEPGRYVLSCQCGLVVPPKQPSELAKAIVNLMKDEILCKKLGDNGYNYVLNNLTFEKIGYRLAEVIGKKS